MLSSKTRWSVNRPEANEVVALSKELGVEPLTAQLLYMRGHRTADKARAFLNVEEQEFYDPFLLNGMDKVVSRIKQAIENEEAILVYGDYDADGVSSTTVLMTALIRLGAKADFYIPNRFTEGYGPNEAAFTYAHESGYKVIITVDTGISALKEAKLAKDLGVDLIITDHHEPGVELPEAYAIIHPKVTGSQYPFHELAGVGVAFKLAHALLGHVPTDLLEVAAIGTIADLVPLRDENRIIAAKGIQLMRHTNRPGLLALLEICKMDKSDITEETIGFMIGPRINAAGRLDCADPAVHLLLTDDNEEAKDLAAELEQLNKERQELVNTMAKEALAEVESRQLRDDEASVIIVGKPGWNAGVIGIVASKLVEKYYRPTIVLSIDEQTGLAKGSARSIEGFDLFENLSTCRDILPHFGGHTMAAGMTLSVTHIDELQSRLNELAKKKLTKEDLRPITYVDVSCAVEDITIDTIQELNKLAPYGVDNPKPKILIDNVAYKEMRRIGSDGSHLKVQLAADMDITLDAIGFGLGELNEEISPLTNVSVVGELSINEWNNVRKPQIILRDLAVTEWQLFDWRGTRDLQKQISKLNNKYTKIIYFNDDVLTDLQFIKDQNICISAKEAASLSFQDEHIILADIPTNEGLLKEIFTDGTKPARIYAVFHQKDQHFFSTIPTRDHFKWYYAFLMKRNSFPLNRADELAKLRGWTKETIQFMTQVFFELDFVTITNGVVSLVNNKKKKDLTESPTYQQKQHQITLEQTYLYSSYRELKQMFDILFTRSIVS
ncbi:single-stranded-DNA-specific exonuclease RecJ [Bacillus sp. HMF5848]|uniref:single-stranded-DNA-specific exonuclease RecJ n=1 Tax=Bacillus sp. HMF5848 TaxID=2495421 RepID=UPI000F78168F|nr:single-stranded-DNA-specific exonuclease RecJ [Bacillus sp. HMF5848]RSK27987.1 single-stranded-DNA-specific exonuclease RecJ [Bacillus sp. HMF5848]